MKKITKSIIALAVLAGLAGCAKEQTVATPSTPDAENKGKIALTLTAGKENPETRAAIDGTDSAVIDWSKDDKISVFDGDNKNCDFTLEEADAGKSTGKFTGTVTKTSTSGYTALYPYQSGASYDGSKVSGVVLNSAQTAVNGSFDPEAALMCARSAAAGEALAFKNVVGYVKFTTNFECSKITLVSNDANDKLAGTVDITPGDTPAVSVTTGATNQISLSPASGATTIAAGTYYIAVLPGTLKSGAKLFFTKTDGTQGYKSYSNIGTIKSNGQKNITKTISADGLREDLSAPGTANCYLIKAAGSYAFKAVQGNTNTSVGSVSNVEVLWESFGTSKTTTAGDLIASAKVNGEYIEFSTPDKFAQGNAVIAAKDASGTILWSWHIWCATEGWEEQKYWDKDDHSKSVGIMMDRNLGATSAAVGEVGSLGLLYQWGRKDPFLGAASFSLNASNSYSQAASTGTWSTSSESVTENSTKNPMTFYTGNFNGMPDDSWGWTSTGTKKSVNDPCPAGWRVPDGGSSGIWANASSTSSNTFEDYGMNFGDVYGSDATIWYPASGYLSYSSGVLYNVGNYGYFWSVTPVSSNSNNAYILNFSSSGKVYHSSSLYRSSGVAVRCLQE